jgi:hypothetical protein
MSPSTPKIVKDLHQFNLAVFRMGKALPKHMRPTLAGRLEARSMDALLSIKQFAMVAAESKPAAMGKVFAALEDLEGVACILEITFDLRAISDGLFGNLSHSLEEIRRQLHGLRRKYAPVTRTTS